jgi:energy-coupling factor transporter transmembrane protein EcfT
MRRTILSADQLAVAMESRCFSTHRTDPAFHIEWLDLLLLMLSLLVFLATLIV